ncbi:MAG TPA: glycoside hydrolase family 36 protein [Verrucomicrobiae bacterium]|nr:glycoside hydrolase family 36 protein [Verrucomicrobiae bacterium]
MYSTLSTINPNIEFALDGITAVYALDLPTGMVEFTCLPTTMLNKRVEKRRILETAEVVNLPSDWLPIPARFPESLVQLHVRGVSGPAAFAQGRTLRNGEACQMLKFESQSLADCDKSLTITTTVATANFAVDHILEWFKGESGFRVWTVFHNRSSRSMTLDMLASFNLNGISPFHSSDASERLRVHRIRSCWSAEGRLESRLLEELHLERSWTGHAPFSERFGQVGSMPVRGFFPFVAIEDIGIKVCWGAQLEIASSWQLEIYRRHDDVSFSGGLADREFGHWWKIIAPRDSFTTPKAILSTVTGDLDDLCHALTSLHRRAADRQPAIERNLPIIFNEWCSSWGNPTHGHLTETAECLATTPVRYLVIDDGWAERHGNNIQQNGDWIVNRKAFPDGLKATCDAIRSHGLVPGLWFEFEVCTEGTQAWFKTDHLLQIDGETLRVGTRRFWDFRDPFTFDYLAEKVITTLRDNGFGYLKVDYNETIGIGVDGAESPGEGLRQHIEGVQSFFRAIRKALPELVIENCSSGGHRLEPSMMAICAMGSFSDAHETVEIPIIAANLHRVILPMQSQVWAVLRSADTIQRIQYSLAATFLGRMTISGNLKTLLAEQITILADAQKFYLRAASIIRDGISRRFGRIGPSYRHPRGWQALRRISADGSQILCVIHTFADAPSEPLQVPLPSGSWKLETAFNLPPDAKIIGGNFVIPPLPDFTGLAVILRQ